MKKIFLISAILFTIPLLSRGQFTSEGKIEYERKVNVHAQLDEMLSGDNEDNEWIRKMRELAPKFTTSYFDLSFIPARTIYKPGREGSGPMRMWGAGAGPANENIVLTEMNSKKVKACKAIFETKFIIEDSMRKMKWKIMDEVRTIANYKCRKAVGKICDSVYVVAFYTEDIVVSGGPEMMSGLPGMIMQLAIPRLHATWIATKVDIGAPKEDDFKIPEKGKHVSQKDLYENLKDSFKSWGKASSSYIWWSML